MKYERAGSALTFTRNTFTVKLCDSVELIEFSDSIPPPEMENVINIAFSELKRLKSIRDEDGKND